MSARVFIATLIAADRLSRGDISAAEEALRRAGVAAGEHRWVEAGSACDIPFAADPAVARDTLEGLIPAVDVIVQPEARRRRRLLVADMDSTMISVECLDELADYAGKKAEIAKVTEQAMRGEIEFGKALCARVELLTGLDESAIERCYAERVQVTPGALELVRTMRREGAYCLLVSGGFSRFADRVAQDIGFDRAVSNELVVEAGRLTGAVRRPIVGAAGKRQALVDAATASGVSLGACVAVGDGANDIPMLEAAGLGIAYHAKPSVAAAASARIEHNDLTALLYAQGYKRSQWETA